ncbi:REP-associated tyrosine transposase [Ectothiorhodospira marina]|uniref:REP element-mobilizing transposase RayT n=1 Tax=Ectothiorhodospira marina TaxID=1396821 RepID=A0A1H7M1Z8_9GAMM|nr:transposase [Ectothiorhodospira marina]SEL05214.1 REP element-mobilizing transposase RayT [Ectothiorhodospira marina]
MPRTANSHRLRLGRFSEPGRLYLVTLTCHRRYRHFTSLTAGRTFVGALISVRHEARTLCYVVMPDHAHWLMQLKVGADLSRVVQKVKSLTTRQMRSGGGLSGPLWQKGFHDRALRKEEDVIAVARYVIANPLRAGLVESIGAYSLWDACWLDG